MGENHKLYTAVDTTGGPNGPEEIMYNLFDFVYNNGSGVSGVRFINDNISGSIHNGTSFATLASQVTSYTYFTGANSYIMLESKNVMPSGNRWQIQLRRVSSSNFSYNFAPRGGWSPVTQAFTGSLPSTGLINWWSLTSVSNYHMLVSSCDLDTYGASATPVEYFRFLVRNPTGNDAAQMNLQSSLRVGGYIPTDAVSDTNPSCILAGIPSSANTSAVYWGRNASDSYNRVPPDTTGATTNLASAGYCRIVGLTEFNSFLNRNGQAVTLPYYLHLVDGSAVVGYFGKYDMLQGHSNNQDGMKDATGNYVFYNNIFFRFNV